MQGNLNQIFKRQLKNFRDRKPTYDFESVFRSKSSSRSVKVDRVKPEPNLISEKKLARAQRTDPIQQKITDFLNQEIATASEISDRQRQKKIGRFVQSLRVQLREEANINAEDNAQEVKNRFLRNISHEIRTPLGAIAGFADLIRQGDCSSELKSAYLSIIDRNSQRVIRIFDDILDLADAESGQLTLRESILVLPDFLDDMSATAKQRAADRGISFELKRLPGLPSIIRTDVNRLNHILRTALDNAFRFTDQGGIEVRVSYVESKLRFVISDTGCGISKQQAAFLFQPFSPHELSPTRKFHGTGLGLSLGKRLAESMGGKFDLVWSAPGRGSVFSLTLPGSLPSPHSLPAGVLDSRLSTGLSDVKRAVEALGDLENLRILVVEDSEDNQVLLKYLLTRMGAKVSLARDGMEALEFVERQDFDVILLDIQMPNLDGYQTAKILRSRGFGQPIIALTAHALQHERERCLNNGFSEFLTKPIRKELIQDTLLKVCSARQFLGLPYQKDSSPKES